MTALLEAPPYFALLSYNMYGKTGERDLAIAEGRALLSAAELDERIMGVERPAPIRHAAYVSTLAQTVGAGRTLDELCAQLAARQVSATDFKIIVKKIPQTLPGIAPAPVLQATVARHIRGKPRLDAPAECFLLVATKRGFWLGKILEESEDRWRRHRVRPMPYIRALPTRVARAMIALVARPGDRIVDPCCGSGTFLIEATDMGIQAEGFDINPKMVSASNINLQHFGLAPVARLGDARRLTGRWDAVVADPPYGHIGNYRDASDTPDILRNLLSLAPRIAVVTPNPHEPSLLGASGARPPSVATIPLPVSRSLTRYIHVLQAQEISRAPRNAAAGRG